jgi:hypothetical protein
VYGLLRQRLGHISSDEKAAAMRELTITLYTKLSPQMKLVDLTMCLKSPCWRVYFSLGLKLNKSIPKPNYRTQIHYSLLEILLCWEN